MADEILTIEESARYLTLGKKPPYRLASEGKLSGFKAGGIWQFKSKDIHRWIETSKVVGSGNLTREKE